MFQDFEIDEHQAVVAGMLAMEAEIFLICHEFAHGLLADMPPGSDAFLKELQVGLDGLSADWREELSADRLALFLAIGKRPGPRDGHQLSMQYAGWEFSLLLHREWERYEETVTSASVSFTTHPPARDRVQDLRDTLRRYTGLPEASNAFSAAEAFATVFSGMVNSMFSEEFRQGAARRDELRANKLVALAQMCSAGAVPDYSRFVPEAMDLLQQAEGWTLLQHVCDATAPLRDEVAMDFKNLQIVAEADTVMLRHEFGLIEDGNTAPAGWASVTQPAAMPCAYNPGRKPPSRPIKIAPKGPNSATRGK
ncbi:hypothetical protein [Rhizobium leguminosarum]|uniref:hypothetical protein n=1 Tax=Rhizobium leguminosarum TaxID=384 RepID=UPI001C914720|nr:hypothetical protein [Rhizobium leguminosarum]MBY3003896.1 hypothetical protein [Rhizobium leguminosarum]